MNLLKSIFKYFNNKLLYLILIVGLPAILAGFCISGQGVFDILMHFDQYQFTGFIDVYMKMLGRKPLWLYIQPVALIGLSLGLSLLYATIDSHMRMGEFTIRNVVRKLDYNFIACLKFVFSLALAGHLLLLLLTLLVFTYYKIYVLAANLALAWSLTAITMVIFAIVYLAIFTWLILWLPTMLHTGAGDNRAFIMASKQIAPVFMKGFSALSLPFIPYLLFMALNSYFAWGVSAIFDILCFVFFGIILVITMNTLYYDLNSIEREDLKSIIWSKKI